MNRFKLLLDAQKYVKNVSGVQFVYANVNCNLEVKFCNYEGSFFISMQKLCKNFKIYWTSMSLFLLVMLILLYLYLSVVVLLL